VEELVHVDLYTGIAGFTLACLWNGIKTILFVEIDKYCQKVLRLRFPNVPIVEDIRDVKKIKEVVANAEQERCLQCPNWRDPKHPRYRQGVSSSRSQVITNASRERLEGEKQKPPLSRTKQFARCGDGNWRGNNTTKSPAILVTAGFPCQPFSVAGKRQGERDDRYLWPETLAVIKAVKPNWVLLENVTGIINLALDTVLSDLEGAGYSCETLIIPACAVNAWHRRDRIWIVAHSNGNGKGERYRSDTIGKDFAEVCQWRDCQSAENQKPNIGKGCQNVAYANGDGFGRYTETKKIQSKWGAETTALSSSEDVADTHREGLQRVFNASGEQGQKPRDEQPFGCGGIPSSSQRAVESQLGMLANGLPSELVGYLENEPDIPRVSKGVKDRVNKLKALGNAIYWPVAYEIIKAIKVMELV